MVRLEIKADKSPKIPPPKEIKQSDLLKFSFKSCSIILFAIKRLLFFSFAESLNILTLYFLKDLSNFCNKFFGSLLSHTMHIFFYFG